MQIIKDQWTNKEIVEILEKNRLDKSYIHYNIAIDKIISVFNSFAEDIEWMDNAEKKLEKPID
jgi:hypothetical protein